MIKEEPQKDLELRINKEGCIKDLELRTIKEGPQKGKQLPVYSLFSPTSEKHPRIIFSKNISQEILIRFTLSLWF